MIYIDNFSGDTAALTLAEKHSLTGNTYYYLQLTNCQNLQNILLQLTDISPYPTRFNLFEINLTASALTGYYDYECFVSNTSGLNSMSGLTSVEIGKLLYKVPETNVTTYNPSETNYTYKE